MTTERRRIGLPSVQRVRSGAPAAKQQDFYGEYSEAVLERHRQAVLVYYKRRYRTGRRHLKLQTEGRASQAEDLRAFDEKYERLIDLVPEMAWNRARIEKHSSTDPISGLHDKKIFGEMYEFALETLQQGEQIVLVTFDLDKFKDINENIGHVNADHVLGRIGKAITTATRSDDFATRIGGDEFTIILNRVKIDTDIVQLIQRIGEHISKVTWTTRSGEQQGISFSAGYTIVQHGTSPFFDDVRNAADVLAGYSKKLGRNRLTVARNEQQYTCYELRLQTNGTKRYEVDQEGQVADLEQHSYESCLSEVTSNGQRITEEIERFFESTEHLITFIQEKFSHMNPQDLYDLSDRQKAKVLLHVRHKGNDEGITW